MKVVFAAPLSFGLQNGGMQMQVRCTAQALEALGIEVTWHDPWQQLSDDVEVCHIFTTSAELLPVAMTARRAGTPVVLSPIYNDQASWRTLRMKTLLGRHARAIYSLQKATDQLLREANIVLPLSEEEKLLHMRVFDVAEDRLRIVPNGVDARFGDADPTLFIKHFGFRPDVLFVGRIDQNKNLAGLLRALEGTATSLAVIGFPSARDPGTFQAVRAAAGKHVTFVGALSHDDPLLASAYAAAHVFCLPSIKEVMPLTVLEAVLAGCSVILTQNTAMTTMLGDGVCTINPRSPTDIARAIESALAAPRGHLVLRERLLRENTWAKIGERLADVYTELTSGS